MNIYIDLLMVAAITIYIVDLSGFTQSWRSALAKALQLKEMKAIKPFDCGQCMTWWMCLLYALIVGQFSLTVVAYSALLAFLSIPIGQIMIFVREWTLWMLNKLMPRL